MIPRANNLFLGVVIILSVALTLRAEVKEGNDGKDDDEVMVNTSAGKALGFRISTSWGYVIRYFGIPYAEPLTKSQRFGPSVPLLGQAYLDAKKINEILHGNTGPPPACIQNRHLPEFSHPSLDQGGLKVAENCLMLNVYQPGDMKPGDRLPILLWVPGDGYSFADTIQYDGSALAALGKVIVITLNYRVGIFGFASMGNSTLPGNAALTDIVSALKFIIHNAQGFNGDSTRITLGGRFSGAMAISALVTSPLFYRDNDIRKSPLVHRVILHGGAASTEYSVDSDPLEGFQMLASTTECSRGDGHHTLECLKMLDSSELLEKASTIGYSWRPAIDGINIHNNPIKAIEFGNFSTDITFLIGDNSGSGSICYTSQKYQKSQYMENFSKDDLLEEGFIALAKNDLKEFYKTEAPQLSSLASHEYYYRLPPNGVNSRRDSYFRFCGALYIRTPVELFARYASRLNSVVYRYEYAYRASSSINPSYFQGALGDEIIFTFPTKKTEFDANDQKIFELFLHSWANFITNGNPSTQEQKWEAFDEMEKHVIGITDNGLVNSTSKFLDTDVHFWRDVFVPVSKAILYRQGIDRTSCPVRERSNSSMGFFSVFFITGACALSLVFLVYLIRNWQKPYLFKFG